MIPQRKLIRDSSDSWHGWRGVDRRDALLSGSREIRIATVADGRACEILQFDSDHFFAHADPWFAHGLPFP